MRLLGTAEGTSTVEPNWLAEAELLGKVEIGYRVLSAEREVRIEMGKWGRAHVSFWGHGETIQDACREAVEKARPFAQHFPHPRDC